MNIESYDTESLRKTEGLYTYETTEDTLATTPNMTMFFL